MLFRRGWLLAAVLALLAAQTLGLAHRVVHPGVSAPVHSHDHAHDHAHESADGLFADHDDAPDCRLYDQLSHADSLPVLPLAVAALLVPAFLLACREGETVARHVALFQARGPPLIR